MSIVGEGAGVKRSEGAFQHNGFEIFKVSACVRSGSALDVLGLSNSFYSDTALSCDFPSRRGAFERRATAWPPVQLSHTVASTVWVSRVSVCFLCVFGLVVSSIYLFIDWFVCCLFVFSPYFYPVLFAMECFAPIEPFRELGKKWLQSNNMWHFQPTIPDDTSRSACNKEKLFLFPVRYPPTHTHTRVLWSWYDRDCWYPAKGLNVAVTQLWSDKGIETWNKSLEKIIALCFFVLFCFLALFIYIPSSLSYGATRSALNLSEAWWNVPRYGNYRSIY